MTVAESEADIKITTDTPYLALTGELWGLCCEDCGANWPRFDNTTLYFIAAILVLCYWMVLAIRRLRTFRWRECQRKRQENKIETPAPQEPYSQCHESPNGSKLLCYYDSHGLWRRQLRSLEVLPRSTWVNLYVSRGLTSGSDTGVEHGRAKQFSSVFRWWVKWSTVQTTLPFQCKGRCCLHAQTFFNLVVAVGQYISGPCCKFWLKSCCKSYHDLIVSFCS